MENEALANYLLWICAILSGGLIVWRVTTSMTKYIRHVTCLANDTQRYFATASRSVSWIKKNILYAPMFRKRRNREFQLSKAANMGTLPTRFQSLFLIAYVATNVAFCVVDIDFTSFSNGGKQLRNRSGVLSVVNMVRSCCSDYPMDRMAVQCRLTDVNRSLSSSWPPVTTP